jgi:hypothetical protein
MDAFGRKWERLVVVRRAGEAGSGERVMGVEEVIGVRGLIGR